MLVSQAILDDQERLHLVGNYATAKTCGVAEIHLVAHNRHELKEKSLHFSQGVCHGLAPNHHADDAQHADSVWIAGESNKDDKNNVLGIPKGEMSVGVYPDYGFVLNLQSYMVSQDDNGGNGSDGSDGADGSQGGDGDGDGGDDATRRRYLRTTTTRLLEADTNLTTQIGGADGDEEDYSDKFPGGQMSGLPAVVYGGIMTEQHGFATVQVAINKEHVYTLSVDSLDGSSDPEGLVPIPPMAFVDLNNPTLHTLVGKYKAGLVIQAFKKVPFNETLIQPLGEPVWKAEITPENDQSIAHAAGLVLLGDVMLVAGSTNATGSGLGVSDGRADMDGFVTKLNRADGSEFGQSNDTAGEELSAIRINTQTNATDYVYGICQDLSGESGHDYVYVVGSTNGHFQHFNISNDVKATQAFILRIEVATLKVLNALQLGTVDNVGSVTGLACGTTASGNHVYLAGNVQDGAIDGPNEPVAGGKSDVFVARIDVAEFTLQWARQIGGPEHEVLAPRGGLIVSPSGKAILVGNTQGSLYRYRDEEDETDTMEDIFVAMVTDDGEIPAQVPSGETPATPIGTSPETTEVPTASPPAPTTTQPTATPPPPKVPQKFDFKDMSMRLKGVPKLSADAQQAFAESLKQFYQEMIYKDRRTRRLQEVSDFTTDVKVQKQQEDALGNTIYYHQTITFIAKSDIVTDAEARGLLKKPFADANQELTFVTLLGQNNEEFLAVTGAKQPRFADEPPDEEPKKSSSDGGGLDIMIFVYIGAAIFLCCIGSCWYVMRKQNESLLADTDESYDPERDMYDNDRPEQPLDQVEKKTFDGEDEDSMLDMQPEPRQHGDRYGMSIIGDEMFKDEHSERSGGNTSGFGNDFDQPEKRKPTVHDMDEDDAFGIDDVGSRDLGAEEYDSASESESGDDDDDESGSDDDDEEESGSEEGDESSSEGDRFA